MASSSRQRSISQALSGSLSGLLRCPVCKGPLSVEDVPAQQRISCLQCARCYPVIDGLPVLIPERAIAKVPDPSSTGDTASH
ncbi:Trm112 family protein [Granulicella aggregans]|uniref:Trm112 family protein n=1 Tax=Granulicella aggregans TaxID=474949 RepID=UPI0037BFB4AF